MYWNNCQYVRFISVFQHILYMQDPNLVITITADALAQKRKQC